MADVWQLAEQLEMEAVEAGIHIGFAFDLTVIDNVLTLPDTLPSKAAMLEVLGGYRHTRAVEKLTRSECYLYLGHAKKWHKQAFEASDTVQFAKDLADEAGKKFNLSGVSTVMLQQMVQDIYPDALPTLISTVAVAVNYRDMQDTLRVVRDFNLCPGVQLKLNAKTSDMYDQMAQVFGDNWVDNWGDISLTVKEYLRIANDTANRLKGFMTNV